MTTLDKHFEQLSPLLDDIVSRIGDLKLCPYKAGAGTTGLVADRLGRNAILIELNPQYVSMSEDRIRGDAPLFVEFVEGD